MESWEEGERQLKAPYVMLYTSISKGILPLGSIYLFKHFFPSKTNESWEIFLWDKRKKLGTFHCVLSYVFFIVLDKLHMMSNIRISLPSLISAKLTGQCTSYLL